MSARKPKPRPRPAPVTRGGFVVRYEFVGTPEESAAAERAIARWILRVVKKTG
jgi:hypothetical protein